MVLRLDSRAGDFEARFAEFLAAKREVSEDVDAVVRDIIARVRAEGDAALIDLSLKFDLADLAPWCAISLRGCVPRATRR